MNVSLLKLVFDLLVNGKFIFVIKKFYSNFSFNSHTCTHHESEISKELLHYMFNYILVDHIMVCICVYVIPYDYVTYKCIEARIIPLQNYTYYAIVACYLKYYFHTICKTSQRLYKA